jgi:glutamine amidotransferase
VAELTLTLRELTPKIAAFGTFNYILSNGQALWAHASTKLCYLQRAYPFCEVQLKDEDVRVNLAELNGPDDRLVIVVTEPLTTNENWKFFEPGELRVFESGSLLTENCRKMA